MFKAIKSKLLVLTLSVFAAASANAGEILFALVGDTHYTTEGYELASWLDDFGLSTDYNVTTRVLSHATYNDYDNFDQIWVYDLSPYADNSYNQQVNYQRIADWYTNSTDQNIILDGRIISSSTIWSNYSTNTLGPGGEIEYIQNYRDQLDLRGGGLVLGTDHATAFTNGINQINYALGINTFTGYYYQSPLEAYVDENSPLYVPELKTCSSDPSQQCINDNSSTSFVATGAQPNGDFLTPVAWHGAIGDAYGLAAVSTNMGSITFGTCGGANQPPCTVPEPAPITLIGLGLLGLSLRRKKLT